MPWYRLPNGSSAHIKLAGPREKWPKHCQAPLSAASQAWCSCMAEFQCDWKMPGGGTCSKHLCKPHAFAVGEGKHLCPAHQIAYTEWLARKRPHPQPHPHPSLPPEGEGVDGLRRETNAA